MLRKTRQRSSIWEAIKQAGRPLTPQEVLDATQQKLPRLGIATVYRTINALMDEGEIRAVHIPGQAARYEPAHLDHHHHFYCRECARVYDVAGCALRAAPGVPDGFTVESHEITLVGVCATCA